MYPRTIRGMIQYVLHQRADQSYSPPVWFGERESLTKTLSDYLFLSRQLCHIAGEA
jgi:hypothetical protein